MKKIVTVLFAFFVSSFITQQSFAGANIWTNFTDNQDVIVCYKWESAFPLAPLLSDPPNAPFPYRDLMEDLNSIAARHVSSSLRLSFRDVSRENPGCGRSDIDIIFILEKKRPGNGDPVGVQCSSARNDNDWNGYELGVYGDRMNRCKVRVNQTHVEQLVDDHNSRVGGFGSGSWTVNVNEALYFWAARGLGYALGLNEWTGNYDYIDHDGRCSVTPYGVSCPLIRDDITAMAPAHIVTSTVCGTGSMCPYGDVAAGYVFSRVELRLLSTKFDSRYYPSLREL